MQDFANSDIWDLMPLDGSARAAGQQAPLETPNVSSDVFELGALEHEELGFVEGIKDVFGAKLLPFVGAAVEAKHLANLHSAVRRVEEGTQSEEDEQLLADFLRLQQRAGRGGVGYKVATILAELPAFVAEFAAGGAAVAKAGAKVAAAKAVKEAVEKAARKSAQMAVAKWGVSKGVARAGAGIAKTSLMAGAQLGAITAMGEATGLAMAPFQGYSGGSRISANAWRRALPDMALSGDESTQLTLHFYNTADEFLDALPAAVADEYIEILSERSGAGIRSAFQKLPGADQVAVMQASVARWWTQKYGEGAAAKLMKRIAKAGGWDGVLEEFAEERLGGFLRGATGVEEGGILANTFPDLDQMAAELIAFSVPAVGAAGIRAATERPIRPDLQPGVDARRMAQESQMPLQPMSPEQLADTLDSIEPELEGATVVEEPTPQQEALQRLAAQRGTHLIFVGKEDGEPIEKWDGRLRREGVIFVDANAARPIEDIVLHESVHDLQQKYPELHDALVGLAQENIPEYEQWLAEYKERYKKATGRDLDASRESTEGLAGVADAHARLIWIATTPQGQQALSNVLQDDRNMVERIVDWLRNTAAKILGREQSSGIQRRLDRLMSSFGVEGEVTPDAAYVAYTLGRTMNDIMGLTPAPLLRGAVPVQESVPTVQARATRPRRPGIPQRHRVQKSEPQAEQAAQEESAPEPDTEPAEALKRIPARQARPRRPGIPQRHSVQPQVQPSAQAEPAAEPAPAEPAPTATEALDDALDEYLREEGEAQAEPVAEQPAAEPEPVTEEEEAEVTWQIEDRERLPALGDLLHYMGEELLNELEGITVSERPYPSVKFAGTREQHKAWQTAVDRILRTYDEADIPRESRRRIEGFLRRIESQIAKEDRRQERETTTAEPKAPSAPAELSIEEVERLWNIGVIAHGGQEYPRTVTGIQQLIDDIVPRKWRKGEWMLHVSVSIRDEDDNLVAEHIGIERLRMAEINKATFQDWMTMIADNNGGQVELAIGYSSRAETLAGFGSLDPETSLAEVVIFSTYEDQIAPSPEGSLADLVKEEVKNGLFPALPKFAMKRPAAAQVYYGLLVGRDLSKVSFEAANQNDIELGVLMAAHVTVRNSRQTGDSPDQAAKRAYAALVDLYNRQPVMKRRDAERVALQQYSTPVPLAYAAGLAVGLHDDLGMPGTSHTILEPTSGLGAMLLAEQTRAESNTQRRYDLADISEERLVYADVLAEWLGTLPGDAPKALHSRFTGAASTKLEDALQPSRLHEGDVVLTNPPFGETADGRQYETKWRDKSGNPWATKKRDHYIAANALENMAHDGQAVLIIGAAHKLTSDSAALEAHRKQAYKGAFYQHLYKRYNVTQHITVAGSLYEQQGAAWPVDVIVVNGRRIGGQVYDDSRAASWKETPVTVDSWNSVLASLSIRTASKRTEAEQREVVEQELEEAQQEPSASDAVGDALEELLREEAAGELKAPTVKPETKPRKPREPKLEQPPLTEPQPQGNAPKAPPLIPPGDAQAVDDALTDLLSVPREEDEYTLTDERYQKIASLLTQKAELENLNPADVRQVATLAVRAIANTLKARGQAADIQKLKDPRQRMRQAMDRWVNEVQNGTITWGTAFNDQEDLPEKKLVEDADSHVQSATASGARSLGTVTPRNLDTALRGALERLQRSLAQEGYENIDAYVMAEMGWSQAELYQRLGAEQIDRVALSIYNFKQGKGFVLADQTGVGKGRVVATLIQWTHKQPNLTPVFVTEKPDLYKDMFRDLYDTGGTGIVPYITNDIVSVELPEKDKDGVARRHMVERDKASREIEYEHAKKHGKLSSKYGAVFTTYPQLGLTQGKTVEARHGLLKHMLLPDPSRSEQDRHNNLVFILDEVHNMSGQEAKDKDSVPDPLKNANPDTEQKISQAAWLKDAVDHSAAALYSSATFAKNPHALKVFTKTDLPLVFGNMDKLIELVKAGGQPIEQFITIQLAHAGQMARAERSYEGIEFNDLEVAPLDSAGNDLTDRVAGIVRRLFELDRTGMASARLEMITSADENASEWETAGLRAGYNVNAIDFANLMHRVSRNALLAVKARALLPAVVESVRAGQKPTLFVENTLEQYLHDLAEDMGLEDGDTMDAGEFNFAHYIEAVTQRLLRVSISDPSSTKTQAVVGYRYITDQWLRDHDYGWIIEQRQELLADAAKQLAEIPLSPIDYVMSGLRHANISCYEITGRNIALDYSPDFSKVTFRSKGRSQNQKASDNNDARTAFNNGTMDVLLFNVSGATGFSMHASKTVPDQRQRVMFIWQAPEAIATLMQGLGRINRTGQVVEPTPDARRFDSEVYGLPEFRLVYTDMPVEMRAKAKITTKVKQLGALTTAAAESGTALDQAPPFLNKYGDRVVRDVLTEMPFEQVQAMEAEKYIETDKRTGNYRASARGLASKITTRAIVLDKADQQTMFEAIVRQYTDLISRLDATGQNDLEAKLLDFQAVLTKRTVVEERDGMSPFQQPVAEERLDVRLLDPPIAYADMKQRVIDFRESKIRMAQEVADASATQIQAAKESAAKVKQEFKRRQGRLDQLRKDLEAAAKAKNAANALQDQDQIDKAESAYNKIAANIAKTQQTQVKAVIEESTATERLDKVTRDAGAVRSLLSMFQPGAELVYSPVPEQDRAVSRFPVLVADLRRRSDVKNPLRLDAYEVEFYWPQSSAPLVLDGKSVMQAEFQSKHHHPVSLEKAVSELRASGREQRSVLTGNLARAFMTFGKKGTVQLFTTAEGKTRLGFVLNTHADAQSLLDQEPVVFQTDRNYKKLWARLDQMVEHAHKLDAFAVTDGLVIDNGPNAVSRPEEIAIQYVLDRTWASLRERGRVAFVVHKPKGTRVVFKQLTDAIELHNRGLKPQDQDYIRSVEVTGQPVPVAGKNGLKKRKGMLIEGNADAVAKALRSIPPASESRVAAHISRISYPGNIRQKGREQEPLDDTETLYYEQGALSANKDLRALAGLPGKTVREVDISEDIGILSVPKARKRGRATRHRLSFDSGHESWQDKLRRKLQNRDLRWARLQQEMLKADRHIDDAENVVLAMEAYPGLTSAQLEDWDAGVQEPLLAHMRKHGISLTDADLYVYARHAEERNRFIAAKRTEAWAKEETKRIKNAAVNNLILLRRDLAELKGVTGAEDRRRELEQQIEAEMMRVETPEAFLPATPPDTVQFVTKNDPGSGMKTATARKYIAQYENGKNGEAYKELGRMIDRMNAETRERQVQAGLISRKTAKMWEKNFRHYVPLRTEVEPGQEFLGKRFDTRATESKEAWGRRSLAHSPVQYSIRQARRAIIRSNKNAVGQSLLRLIKSHREYLSTGFDVRVERSYESEDGEVMLPTLSQPREDEFAVKVGGRTHYIAVYDPLLLRSLNGMGTAQLTGAVRMFAKITRTLSALNTGFNPEFMFTNFFRDVAQAGLNVTAEQSKKMAAQIVKDTLSMKPLRATFAVLRGNFDASNEWQVYFKELRDAGGLAGWYYQPDFLEQAVELEKALKDGSLVKQRFRHLGQLIEDSGRAVENGVRLATYRRAREAGMSVSRAASLARNVTVNFNQQGEWGQYINAFYMFYNASMQGTATLFRVLRHPRARRMVAGLIVSSYLLDAMNRAIGDDDEYGNSIYETIPDHVRERNLILMLPNSGGKYVKVPLPYGWNIFHAVGTVLGGLQNGEKTVGGAINTAASVAWGAFYPLGSESSLLQAVTPSIADPFVQIATNETFYGAPIRPPVMGSVAPPRSQQYWASVNPVIRDATEFLNRFPLIGGDEVTPGHWLVDHSPEDVEHIIEYVFGGLGRFAKRTFDIAAYTVTGQEVPTYKVPVLRSFYGEIDERYAKTRYYDLRTDIQRAQKRYKVAQSKADVERLRELRVEDSQLLRMVRPLRAAETRLRRLRDYRSRADTEEQRRQIEKAQTKVYQALISLFQ